jgi:hypothetical protein
MKNKVSLLVIPAVLIANLLFNSCKKDNSGQVENFLPGGVWQLASVMVNHVVGGVTTTDTLNTKCDTTQLFVFNANHTCSYTNFDCNSAQPKATGTWQLASNQLYLNCNMTCLDSTGKKIQPFTNAQIVNLGNYSLILQTGDFGTYYPPTQKLTIYRYGFIRQK